MANGEIRSILRRDGRLETEDDSKVDFLITGDKDLLVLKEIDKTKIITITDFLALLKTSVF